MKSFAVVGCAAISFAAAVPASAQQSRAARDAKYRVETMERILEGAAEHGAKGAQEQFKAMLPGDFLLTDDVRVRGFTIGDWGVFFDVQMPPLESTTPWIVRTLDQNDLDLVNSMRTVQSMAEAINDPAMRQLTLQSVERINLQLGLSGRTVSGQTANGQTASTPTASASARAVSDQAAAEPVQTLNAQTLTQGTRPVEAASFAGDPATTNIAAAGRPPAPPVPPPVLPDNPQAAFHAEVKAATIEAMLEHGAALRLKPEQRLMVAIRGADNLPRLAPGEPDSPTIQITILGADLMAAAANQLSREEVLQRIVVEEVP